jgi:hypothetical protein
MKKKANWESREESGTGAITKKTNDKAIDEYPYVIVDREDYSRSISIGTGNGSYTIGDLMLL